MKFSLFRKGGKEIKEESDSYSRNGDLKAAAREAEGAKKRSDTDPKDIEYLKWKILVEKEARENAKRRIR